MFLLYKFGNFFKLEQSIQIVIFLRKCLSKRILLFPYLWKCKCRFSILLRWSTDHLPSSALLMPFIGIRPIHFPHVPSEYSSGPSCLGQSLPVGQRTEQPQSVSELEFTARMSPWELQAWVLLSYCTSILT